MYLEFVLGTNSQPEPSFISFPFLFLPFRFFPGCLDLLLALPCFSEMFFPLWLTFWVSPSPHSWAEGETAGFNCSEYKASLSFVLCPLLCPSVISLKITPKPLPTLSICSLGFFCFSSGTAITSTMFFYRLCLEVGLFLPLCFCSLIPSAFYLPGISSKLAKDNSLSGLSTLSWIPLPLPPLIHLSYSILMVSRRRNHLLSHHFSAGSPRFRGVKSAPLTHHSQNIVTLELDPSFILPHGGTNYLPHLPTREVFLCDCILVSPCCRPRAHRKLSGSTLYHAESPP